MEKVSIALGSNLGDKAANLRNALERIEMIGDTLLKKSAIYETAPVGAADQPFYNAVLLLSTKLTPLELFRQLKNTEIALGREPDAPRWSNRIIDLDIITYGNKQFDSDYLRIPHAEYQNRRFVLIPLREVLPGWIDPSTGESIDEMIEKSVDLGIFKTDVKW